MTILANDLSADLNFLLQKLVSSRIVFQIQAKNACFCKIMKLAIVLQAFLLVLSPKPTQPADCLAPLPDAKRGIKRERLDADVKCDGRP